MNNIKRIVLLCITLFLVSCKPHVTDGNTEQALDGITPESVKILTAKVADWQIKTFEEQGKYRALPSNPPDWMNRDRYHDLEWHHGALYVGMDQWRKVSGDSKYTQWLKDIGERNQWKLHERPYHADDHVVGQFYLSLYEDLNDADMLNSIREQFDWIMENPKTNSIAWDKQSPDDIHKRWDWSDALFMVPPVWARLAKMTGDERYLEFMDQEYRATYDLLWSDKDHLFWRDSRFISQSEKNGEGVFWSRGNGWVFAGLALMIPDFPENWEDRFFYIDLYKKMAVRIKSLQRDDGSWSMGLLGGIEGYPVKETSGTAFFAYGLAWGINEGILDRETYEPIVLRAWLALANAVTGEGFLGYVQPVGAEPGDSFADATEVYGTGALLAAGSEIYKMLDTKKISSSDQPIKTFMYNGGWCWFQDPRVIIQNGQLIIGGVAGNGRGEAAVGIYDLKKDNILGRVVVHESFDRDDHNSPVFYVRPDGSLLTMYARHSKENKHYYRISSVDNYLEWSEEKNITHNHHVTYMNLYHLEDEGVLYNFYRGMEWNPAFVKSDNHGDSWSESKHFIKNEVSGVQRPYARYTADNKKTIGISFTDAHPRDFGNSLYYVEFRDGNFYRADGSFIKNFDKDGAIAPSEVERIFQGGGGGFRSMELSAEKSAWTSSIQFDDQGHAHIAYTLYITNTDQRYRLASWNGEKWIDREIAYAGTRLYDLEASYTGLVALDPEDPGHIVISSDVNPSTGEPLGGKHQIFRAHVNLDDNKDSIHWEQLTYDYERHNIRPIIVNDEEHSAILWLRGQYNTWVDYSMDVVGIINPDSSVESIQ